MPIKVLVISSYDDAFNAVRPEGELFIGLHRDGVEVEMMTQGNAEYAGRFREAGLKVYDFHPKKTWDPAAVRYIRRILQEGKHDILHLFNKKAVVNGVRAARGLPVKVVTYRGFTGHLNWYDPSVYLTHFHPRVNKITCLADSVRDHVRSNLLFRLPEFAVTVNKGHDLSWYDHIKPADLSEFQLPSGAMVVSCVANARPMKGIRYLIEATHFLPPDAPIHFLLIGNGMDTFSEQIEKSPYRDRIHLAGFRRNALEIVAACDASVLPSIKGEATPKAALEALFLGKPLVFTSIAGNKNMAIHGETAYVAPPCDPKALAEGLLWMWQHPEERRQLGENGRQYISTHFSVARSVQEMKAVYTSLCHP